MQLSFSLFQLGWRSFAGLTARPLARVSAWMKIFCRAHSSTSGACFSLDEDLLPGSQLDLWRVFQLGWRYFAGLTARPLARVSAWMKIFCRAHSSTSGACFSLDEDLFLGSRSSEVRYSISSSMRSSLDKRYRTTCKIAKRRIRAKHRYR